MADDTEKRLHCVMEKLFHTPKHSSLPRQQTRGIKRPHSMSMSKHNMSNSDRDDLLEKALPCRPWDRGDLMRRLATFKSMTWFAKPKAVDAVNCARRGWINVEMDVIACEICGARMLFTTPASWNRHQVEKAASVFSLKLDTGHKLLCPWMDNCCDEKLAYFAPTRTDILVEHYRERSSALLKLSALPLISASAIKSMKSPLLEQFLKQSISVEYDRGPDGFPLTELLGTDCEAVSDNSYCQAHMLLSLCGWQPRILPYFVDCKEGAKKSKTIEFSQETPLRLYNKLAVYSSTSGEKSGSDENSLASEIPCEPNSVVLDCNLCGASTGLWTFSLVSRPLELVRVIGYTEADSITSGTDNLCCGNHGVGGTLNREALLQKVSSVVGKLNMTIAGGPSPAEQNFRAKISVPVIGRNLRARFSNSLSTGEDASQSDHLPNPDGEVTDILKDVDLASDQADKSSQFVKDTGNSSQVASEYSAQEGSNPSDVTDQNVGSKCDGVHLQQGGRNEMTSIAEEVPSSSDSPNKTDVGNLVEKVINTNTIQPSIDKDPKRASSTKKMEFDPLRQHRHFCPLVTSTETVLPGWKQILLALKKEKVFIAIESEDSPMSPSLIKRMIVGGSRPPALFDLNEEYVDDEHVIDEHVINEHVDDEHVDDEDEDEESGEEDRNNQNNNVVVVAEVFPDFSSYFENNLEWEERDEMIGWARTIGKSLQIVLVIKNSWTTKVILSCVLGGSYKAGKKGVPRPIVRNVGIGDELNARSGSHKLGCPLELIGSRNRSTKRWHMTVGCGSHNHALADHVEGYAYAGRMTEKQKATAKRLALSDVEPKKSMTYMKGKWPDMTTKMKQLYDYRYKCFKDDMNGRGVSQFAVEYLAAKQYYVEYRTEEGSNTIQDIFFANPLSMKLLKAFPYVVVMDSTYKTNMYDMPLCEMVGFTCTGRTFCIALSFMTRETQGHYEWVLENLREVYKQIGEEPEAVVTDRDLAEVNAVDRIFPRAKHMLCWVHIQRNCRAYALKKGFVQSAADWFAGQAWGLFESTTVRDYELELQRLRECMNPLLFTYLQNNWLTPWRERIVRCFTDHRLNLFTRTTNRAESQHAALKDYIASSHGGFSSLVRKIDNELQIQLARVRGDMEKDRTTIPLTVMRLVEPIRTVFLSPPDEGVHAMH